MFVTEAFAEDVKPAAEAGADAHGAAVEGAAPAAGAAHTESTAGNEGEHGGGVFPPFDSSTYASQILWLAMTFGLFYLFLKRVILPRVGGILSDRESSIASDLKAAEKMKEEADASVAAYEQELASAKGQVGRHRRQGRRCVKSRLRRQAQVGRSRSRQEDLPPPKPRSPRSRRPA